MFPPIYVVSLEPVKLIETSLLAQTAAVAPSGNVRSLWLLLILRLPIDVILLTVTARSFSLRDLLHLSQPIGEARTACGARSRSMVSLNWTYFCRVPP